MKCLLNKSNWKYPDAGEFMMSLIEHCLNSALEGFTASATTPAGGVVITSDVNGDEGNDYLVQTVM